MKHNDILYDISERLGKIEGIMQEQFNLTSKKLDCIDKKLKEQNGSIKKLSEKQIRRDAICEKRATEIKKLQSDKITFKKIAKFATVFGVIAGVIIEVVKLLL